ncbi:MULTISPECIES: acetyl-CoA carboxylase biotin carboxylase subunit family protein [unclassified Streptomyces]|uniref:ATP-grasp domain-containing protein n=1 Tax=Streptomyces sp. NBC_00060 TaxID=2975636 RepID=A0AAU2H9U1_9ACTN
MTEHVLVFGVGYDIPARMRAFGETAGRKVTTSVMCWPEHLAKTDDTEEHGRIVVLSPDASDEEWIAMARAIDAVEPVTRIGSFYDDCRPQAALVAEVLGLDTHTPEIVELVMNKYAMRQRLAGAGVEATACAVVAGPAEAESALERAGGTGPDPRATVEEFLVGAQYGVEAFSERGEHVVVAVTRKHSDAVGPVEPGRVVPAPLEPERTEAVTRHVIATLDALGVEFGPTHTEVILTEHGPRVIETRLRTGGDEIRNMVTDVTGVDLIESQLQQILGEKVLPGIRATLDDPDRTGRSEAIWFAGAPTAHGELP